MKVSLTESDLPILDFKDVMGIPKKVANIKPNPIHYTKRNHGSLINQTGGKLFRMPSTDIVHVPKDQHNVEVRNKLRSSYTGLSSYHAARTVQSVSGNRSKPSVGYH
jgi:hypothetical protein